MYTYHMVLKDVGLIPNGQCVSVHMAALRQVPYTTKTYSTPSGTRSNVPDDQRRLARMTSHMDTPRNPHTIHDTDVRDNQPTDTRLALVIR